MLAQRLVPATLVLSLVLAACSSNRSQGEPKPESVGARIDSAADRLSKDTLPDTSTVRDTSTSR
jgi:hypothetical protein